MKGKCFCFSTRLLVPCTPPPPLCLRRTVCLPECVCATFYASVWVCVCVCAHLKVCIVNGSHKELPSDWLEQARAAFVTGRVRA